MRRRLHPAPLLLASALAGTSGIAPAQTRVGQTQIEISQTEATRQGVITLDQNDRLIAEIWGLSDDELRRAKVLLQGPRAAFSVPNISPVEALGIHARDEAERQRYAEKVARVVFEDLKRTLAFGQAYQTAITRLTAGTPMVSYDGLPGAVAPIGAADIGNVPRSLVTEPGSTGPSSRARFAPSLTTGPGAGR
jgi:hypothetical protein